MAKIEQKDKQTRYYVVDHAGKHEDRGRANPNRLRKNPGRCCLRDDAGSDRKVAKPE